MTIKDASFRRLPLIQESLAISVEETVTMETSSNIVEAIKRLKPLAEQHYRESFNGKFED